MKIEIWSDYACPYCYIGKRYLEQALKEFEHANSVEVVYKAFELDPSAAKEATTTTLGRIKHKYGKSEIQAQEMIDHIVAMAARVDLDMRYDSVRYTNTFDAHRLTKFASLHGKGLEMSERLFNAYFTQNLPLADHGVLLEIAVELGLDRVETQAMLASDMFAEDVRADEHRAREIGIRSVPHMVIDGQHDFVGAQPTDHLLTAIRDIWAEQQARDQVSSVDVIACDIDGCRPASS